MFVVEVEGKAAAEDSCEDRTAIIHQTEEEDPVEDQIVGQ